MQQGPINQGTTKSFIRRKPAGEANNTGVQPDKKASNVAGEDVEVKATAGVEDSVVTAPAKTLPLGVVMDVSPEALKTKDNGQGGYESAMTLAFVDKSQREYFEKQGAIFPEVGQAVLGDGIGEAGKLEVVSLYDTENPETAQIAKTLEVDRKLLETDPSTGLPAIENYTPTLLAQGEGILGIGQRGVSKDAKVIPEGYVGHLAESKEGAKHEGTKKVVNNLMKTLGTLSGSSLAGVLTIPVLSDMAPILAIGSAGFSFNQSQDVKKAVADQLAYLDSAQKKSPNDLVTMETVEGQTYQVSAKGERKRLQAQTRQTQRDLASTGLLALAGGSSIVGTLAANGVGIAGLAGAAAVAPWLAGGAMVLGNGGKIFDSLSELKTLSKEKAELEALQESGQTHVERVLEGPNQKIGKMVSISDEPIKVPIEERLKEVEKEQRVHRLTATALSGGIVSIGNMVLGAAAVTTVGVAAMAPAGILWAGQSIKQLSELNKEKAELQARAEDGETMVEKQLQQLDGTWKKEKVPISTLLAENKKARNKHKMILTSVGSAGAIAGLTLGAGFSLMAAAPLALVPLAIGAALFPDKVKAFADKVKSLIDGTIGESGKSKRATQDSTEKHVDDFLKKFEEDAAPLRKSNPELFSERPGKLPFRRTQYGGHFHELGRLAKQYAASDNPAERQQYLQHINEALAMAPEGSAAGVEAFKSHFQEMQMEVEAEWVARDIGLEMRTPVTDKVVSNPRVKSRVTELGFPTDNLREQYEESLFLENSPQRLQEMMKDSEAGSRDASRKLFRTEVFKAGRILAVKERDLGVDLYTRYIDALHRPEDEENQELLLKEVAYKQQAAVTPQELQLVASAVDTLNTPLQLAPANPNDPHLTGQLRDAIGEMRDADPELTQKLLQTDAKLRNPSTFEGMTAQQALAERTKLNAGFQAARRGLKQATPEALKTWQEADSKLREASLITNNGASRTERTRTVLVGPEARMSNALRGLGQKQPKLAKKLGETFSLLNNPIAYEGLSPQEVQQKKIATTLELNKVREKLQDKEPELMKLWDGARHEVEKNFFERSLDHNFKGQVLSRPEVKDAAKELGVTEEDVEGLYMGLMRSQLLQDPRALEARLSDETGDAVDPKKAEMLNVIDKTMIKAAAEMSGVEEAPTNEQSIPPQNDPNVVKFLQDNPQVMQALSSPDFDALSQQMNVPADQVRAAYLTLVQADLNPAVRAELQGRIEGGDVQAANINAIGSAAANLVLQLTRPSAEQTEAMVEQNMKGAVVQTVLEHEQIQAKAEELGVDAEQSMKLYLRAELGRNPAIVQELTQKAQRGEEAAAKQLQFLQILNVAVQTAVQEVKAPVNPAA
jgi:hypothetical protein